jgi:hypothetical protein
VTLTQEPELLYDATEQLKFKIKEINVVKAFFEVSGEWTYEFVLSKVSGKWKIDTIAMISTD